MATIPAPTHIVTREEWPDADFDLPDGDLLPTTHDADSDKDEEDWDVEMELGKTGGAKVTLASVDHRRSSPVTRRLITIRPPLAKLEESTLHDLDEDDEGVSTIKVSTITGLVPKVQASASVEEDVEADFALPSDMTQLSLRPLSLHHRGSKSSLEWGERDHTCSSASSSDAYSSLGFGMATSPSSNSTSASLASTDDDVDDEDDGDLDGIVIPTGIFDSEQGRKHLLKVLDMKKKMPTVEEHVKVSTPDPEDDFEIGLIINGDDDLKASKLSAVRQQPRRLGTLSARSKSMPSQSATSTRPPSRVKSERPKTPGFQGISQAPPRDIPSPPLRTLQSKRSQIYQPFPSHSQASTSLAPILPKPSVLRGQKSHSVLKSPSPPSTTRRLSRKASLSSLLETSSAATQAVNQNVAGPSHQRGYNAPTASSRARAHTNSTSRLHSSDFVIPPTRPSTPSTNPAAIRLTLPTNISRIKSRPSISSIFPLTTIPTRDAPRSCTSPPRQAILSRRTPTPTGAPPGPAKVLRRTKRRVFGDGTELDGIDDLPTDRDKEARYRVQPKGSQSRASSGSVPKSDKDSSKGTIRRKLDSIPNPIQVASVSAFNSLGRKQQRVESSSKHERKKHISSPSGQSKRKPTLIRNLGGASVPKVVGEMRWNPQTLRWEGNDQALREFDSVVGTSVRPALITHLTGSSVCSPIGNFGLTARVVGNMVFDPVQMCWKSTLPPEEDEPDIFADLADDEEDGDVWENKAGTIRASQQSLHSISDTSTNTDSIRMQSPSPLQHSHSRTYSESGSERGSRASLVFDVQDEFLDVCRAAETRHRLEMKGWTASLNSSSNPNRSHLYDIRAFALRQY